MSVQNSLDRIFEAMTIQLREVIAPGLEDPFARSQAQAMAEMLANLQTRVEWRCDQLREVVEEVRALLPEEVADPAGLGNAELVTARREALAALARAQAGAGDELRAGVAAMIARQLEAEMGRLRTGMYR